MLQVPCALIIRDGKMLVAKRPLGKDQGGKWESPGGKADEGESHVEALRRELHEELDILAEIGFMVANTQCLPPEVKKPCEVTFYAARILEGEPRPLASDELKWVSAEEFLELDLCIANHKCRAQIAGFLIGCGMAQGLFPPAHARVLMLRAIAIAAQDGIVAEPAQA